MSKRVRNANEAKQSIAGQGQRKWPGGSRDRVLSSQEAVEAHIRWIEAVNPRQSEKS